MVRSWLDSVFKVFSNLSYSVILAVSKLFSLYSILLFKISRRTFTATAWHSFPLTPIQTQSAFCYMYKVYWNVVLFLVFSYFLTFVTRRQLILLLHPSFFFFNGLLFLMDYTRILSLLFLFYEVCFWAFCIQLCLFRAELPENFPTVLFLTLNPSSSSVVSVVAIAVRLMVCL